MTRTVVSFGWRVVHWWRGRSTAWLLPPVTELTHCQSLLTDPVVITCDWSRYYLVVKSWPPVREWLEHRSRDWKVAGSNPCWNGGRIFFSRVDFLCWLLFRYPFHPRVTTVARKKSRSFCQKCRWQVTAKHAYTLRCGFYWTVLRHWSQLVPNMSNDIWGH